MKLWAAEFLKYDIQEYENIIFLNTRRDMPENNYTGRQFLKTSVKPLYAE